MQTGKEDKLTKLDGDLPGVRNFISNSVSLDKPNIYCYQK